MIIAYLILCHNLLGIVHRVGYEMSEPGYESSGYERSMGTNDATGYRSGSVKLVDTSVIFQFFQNFCLLESRNLSHKGHASFMSESMETTCITL